MTGLKTRPYSPEKATRPEYTYSTYWLSQKIDGHRYLIRTGPTLQAFNKWGLEVPVPQFIRAKLGSVRTVWTFDGEFLDNSYSVFDIIETPEGEITSWPFNRRFNLLNDLISQSGLSNHNQIFPVKQDIQSKSRIREFRNMGAEGVILTDPLASYGSPQSKIKIKFVKQIDCVVMAINLDYKENIEIGLYDDAGNLRSVGRVSALTGDGQNVQPQQVVQVNFLYATKSLRLFQPTKPRIRFDVDPSTCKLSELTQYITSKGIIQ